MKTVLTNAFRSDKNKEITLSEPPRKRKRPTMPTKRPPEPPVPVKPELNQPPERPLSDQCQKPRELESVVKTVHCNPVF